jgi:predicted NBD/HSP70 family sugar kinase
MMREINEATVFNLLRSRSPVSRTSLAQLSGLSLNTIIGITNNFIERHLILENGEAESTGGRKAPLLEIHRDGAYAIGLYVTPYIVEGVILNMEGDLIFSESWQLNLHGSSTEGLNRLTVKINELIEHSGLTRDKIVGVGCGLPGTINPDTGYSVDAWHLGWHNVPVRQQLHKRLGLPVFVDNDLNCLTCYELVFNRGRTYQNFLVVGVGGRGLGLGIAIEGKLFRGAWGGGAEFGHTIFELNGRQCECGNKGCLEEYIIDRGTIANYLSLLPANAEAKIDPLLNTSAQVDFLVKQASEGDLLAREAFEQSGTNLGVGLANLVNLFNPECLILNFQHFEAKEFMLESLRTGLHQNTFSQLGKKLKLIIEPLNRSDWARGAGSLVLRDFFLAPSRFFNV